MDKEENKDSNKSTSNEEEKMLVQYQIISDRRISQDELMWQVPALSFTAQAFLFTIALGSGISMESRLISSFLIIISSSMSLQLMSKHRYLEIENSRLLENIEKKLVIDLLHSKDSKNKPSRLAKFSSYKIWMIGMSLFLLIAIVLTGYCLYRII